MTETTESLADALGSAQQGDDAALGRLLDHHVRQLYGEARRQISQRLQPLVDPADLLQSTRMILWVGLRQGKWSVSSSAQLTALARTILRRQVARVCRALKAEFRTNTIDIALSDTLVDCPIHQLGEQNPTEETEVEDVVERVLQGLDAIDRDLIRFRLLGYSTTYAANRLQVSAASLRMRLARLRKRLLEFGALQRILTDD